MKGKIIKDWSKVDLKNPEHQKKLVGAFNHFFRQPDESPVIKKAFQHFATKGDFPAEVLQILEKFHAVPNWDAGYEQLFDIRDFTGTKESGFEILDVQSGLSFAKVKVGEKAKVFKFSGAKTTVTFDRYGGALQWDRDLMEDGKYWNLEDNAIEFRNKAFESRAQDFYDLIEATGSGTDISWQTTSVAATNQEYISVRDALTIEAAAQNILAAVKSKGYGVTPSTPLKLLAPVQLRGRINRALARINQPIAGSPKDVTFNIEPVFTLMLANTADYYLVLPGRKLKGGYRMNLTLFADFDILAYADLVAGWQRYGGAIGDTDQVRRCKTS